MGFFVILALLSYVTTVHYGEDDWPPASLQILVLDAAGSPVEGATLSLFRENTPATEFQQAICYSSNWASNRDGSINLLVKPLRYKVTSYRLFWLLAFNHSNVDFEARLIAPGFEPARVLLRTLLNAGGLNGRRPVDEAEATKGFAFDEFDVFQANVILKR